MNLSEHKLLFEDTLVRVRVALDKELRANGNTSRILDLSESAYHIVCVIGNIEFIMSERKEGNPWEN